MTPISASAPKSKCPRQLCEGCSGTGAEGGAQPAHAAPAAAWAACAQARAFSRSSGPARPATARAKWSRTLAATAAAPAGRPASARFRWKSPGVEDGTRIRLAGEGEAGLRGGPPGDLYIFLSIEPDELFQRDGADLFCRVPIQMTTAALGGQIEVPTISGDSATIRIPEGTEAGHEFRVHGKGMPVLRSKATGDLYVQVEVETPKNLTRKQKELLREFEKGSNADHQPGSDRISVARQGILGAGRRYRLTLPIHTEGDRVSASDTPGDEARCARCRSRDDRRARYGLGIDAARALVSNASPRDHHLQDRAGTDLCRRGRTGARADRLRPHVFLDAKLLDIGNTVERATAQIAALGARYLTVHATDTKTLAAAVTRARNRPACACSA